MCWHCSADYYMYRRFLRARQHDIERAKEMWQKHLEWRKVGNFDNAQQKSLFCSSDTAQPKSFTRLLHAPRCAAITSVKICNFNSSCVYHS